MSHTFSVWAPAAERVDLHLRGDTRPMQRAAAGCWYVHVEEAGPGDTYAFALDGGEPRPDPRSEFQPDGVHGRSAVVDHAAFTWHDQDWRGFPLRDAVIYELHTGTFSDEGTFDGVVAHLEDLVDLGINTVELLPVATFPGARGWGYDGVDLYAPHPAYGGPEGLRRLVDACHARGLAVVMDVVYNHFGPEGNYVGGYGPYFTDRYRTPWGSAVNYDDAESDAVRGFVLDNAEMWLREYHCDGLRLDAVHAILDTSATHLLEAIVDRVAAPREELDRELWVIAESDANDPRLVRERSLGGYGLDAQWSDNFHHALHAVLTGERSGYYEDFGSLEQLCTALREAFVYQGEYSPYRRRHFGRSTHGLPLTRFLGYSQNHDQVGNRAAGERLCHLVSEGRARIAAALTLLSPFVPMLFQGEEWAASSPFQYFTDLGDPELQRAVSEGRRSEFADFGWHPEDVPDPQQRETFARSKLRWDERAQEPHASMLEWYRSLLRIRASTPGLRDGERTVEASCDAGGVLRYAKAGLVVVCNLGGEPATVSAGAALLLASPGAHSEGGSFVLAPDAVVVTRSR